MSEPTNEKPGPATSKKSDIDRMLDEVGELASRAEKLVMENSVKEKVPPAADSKTTESAPPPPANEKPASAETPSASSEPQTEKNEEFISQADLKQLDDLMQKQAGDIAGELKTEPTSVEPPQQDLSSAKAAEPETIQETDSSAKELAVDKQTELLADNEINEAFKQIQGDPSSESSPPSPAEETPPEIPFIETCPRFLKTILLIFFTLNRPFLWVPVTIKNILGIIGIGTLLFTLGLWIVLVILDKHS